MRGIYASPDRFYLPSDPHRRIKSAIPQLAGLDLAHTATTHLHILKACGVVQNLRWMQLLIGCSNKDFVAMYPLLLHLESLVYRGDLLYEAYQHGGRQADPEWYAGIRTILEEHRLLSPPVQQYLDELREYFELESRICTQVVEITDSVLQSVAYLRSSDIRMLIAAICTWTGATVDAALHRIDPVLCLREIRDDLETYSSDVNSNDFNTLRLYVRRYGTAEARYRLRDTQLSLVDELLDRWRRAPRASDAALWSATFETKETRQLTLTRILPRKLLLHIARARLTEGTSQLAVIPEPMPEFNN